jgi:hypothetical protein
MKEMTVAELIESLSLIEDKTLPVRTIDSSYNDVSITSIRILTGHKSVGFKNERTETWVEIK